MDLYFIRTNHLQVLAQNFSCNAPQVDYYEDFTNLDKLFTKLGYN